MKKIIKKCMLLMALSTQSFATINNGLYTGFGLGVFDFIPNLSINVTTPAGEAFSAFLHQGNTGYSGELMLGYNFLFNDWFALGVQVDGRFTNLTSRFEALANAGALRQQFDFSNSLKASGGLNVRPTFPINDNATGFFILGVRRSNASTTITENDFIDPIETFTISGNNNGFEYGLGTELCLYSQLGLRIEATQTSYQSKSFFQLGAGNSSIQVKTNQLLLSLIWYPNFYLD